MILDRPIHPLALQKLSKTEKIQLLKTAYLEALQIIQQAQNHKLQTLSNTVDSIDEKKISDIKKIISAF